MKCYTIREGQDPKKGLFVTSNGGLNPSVVIGDGDTATAIPVSEECATKYQQRRDYIRRIRKLTNGLDDRLNAEECDAELKREFNIARRGERYPGQLRAQMEMEWEERAIIREQFAQDSHHLIHGYIWTTEDSEAMQLHTAELSDRNEKHPLRITRDRRDTQGLRFDSSQCLVHVDVDALEGGKMWLEATNWDEYLNPSVEREFKPFPSCGVELIAIGTGASGGPQALVRMTKKASFRICRTGNFEEMNRGLTPPYRNKQGEWVGDVDAYVYPVMVVVWPGSSLRLFPPKKYEKSSKRRAA